MSVASHVSDNKSIFGEPKGPSIESSDPQERKFARQLRIQKRAEDLQKLVDDDANKIDESLTERQIRNSSNLLQDLINEGYEVITNVRIANDARELERQKIAKVNYDRLIKRLDENTENCKKEYDLVTARWPEILKSNDPLDIHSAMKLQMEKCDKILAEKDAIIIEFKEELARADHEYSENQKKQKDDIKLLIERIDNQMSTVENAYTRELQLIEKTLKLERDTLVDNFQKQWDVLYKQEQEDDRACDEQIDQVMREYEVEMKRMRMEFDEEYRAQKIMLDKECQELELQVEQTKGQCLLNEEKLSYNFTVLKSRQEENATVKSQQKRKINKLQSQVNALKQNYADLVNNTQAEKEKLTKQILKFHKKILDIEEKSNLFARNSDKQYLDIWDMNTETANQLIEQILTADRLIHERTLGVFWEPPATALPKKEDMPSYCEAMKIIQKRKEEEAELYKKFQYEKLDPSSVEASLERKILNNILKQISNCSEYLIEDKLKELILNYSEEERDIVKLDSIFQALSISTSEEINMLLNFFLPYAYCPICFNKEETITTISTPSTPLEPCECHFGDKEKKLIQAVKAEIQPLPESTIDLESTKSITLGSCGCESLPNSECPSLKEDEVSEKVQIEEKPSKFMCDKGHVLEIESINVTKAIKDLVTTYRDVEQKKKQPFEERVKEKKFTVSRNISAEDVKNYWSKYRQIFGEYKEKLWDVILIGLSKYHEGLQKRHKLCTEIKNLKKQNDEIRHLLKNQEACSENGLASLQKLTKNPIQQFQLII